MTEFFTMEILFVMNDILFRYPVGVYYFFYPQIRKQRLLYPNSWDYCLNKNSNAFLLCIIALTDG